MSVWTRVLLVLHALAPFFRSSALMIGIYFDVLAAADARGALTDVAAYARRRAARLSFSPRGFEAAVAPMQWAFERVCYSCYAHPHRSFARRLS